MLLNRFLLFAVSFFIGMLLARMHLPIPFLLGGMLVGIACKTMDSKSVVTWPKQLREAALIIAGYGIGANFSLQAWNNMLQQSLGMVEATGSILLASVALSYITAKATREDYKSCLMGMLPGGITIMMLMAEEDKRVNPNIVAVMQIIRLVGVVIAVPFLVLYLLNARVVGDPAILADHGGLHWLIFIPLGIIGALAARVLHISTPNLLGPILMTAAFSVLYGKVQPVPGLIMEPAQVCIGIYMGMQMDVARIKKTKKILPFIVASTGILILISIGMAYVLSARYGFTLVTAFLAMAPGGIAEMALAGLSMGEDVSIILTYQIMRMVTINLCVAPLLQYFFKRENQTL